MIKKVAVIALTLLVVYSTFGQVKEVEITTEKSIINDGYTVFKSKDGTYFTRINETDVVITDINQVKIQFSKTPKPKYIQINDKTYNVVSIVKSAYDKAKEIGITLDYDIYDKDLILMNNKDVSFCKYFTNKNKHTIIQTKWIRLKTKETDKWYLNDEIKNNNGIFITLVATENNNSNNIKYYISLQINEDNTNYSSSYGNKILFKCANGKIYTFTNLLDKDRVENDYNVYHKTQKEIATSYKMNVEFNIDENDIKNIFTQSTITKLRIQFDEDLIDYNFSEDNEINDYITNSFYKLKTEIEKENTIYSNF